MSVKAVITGVSTGIGYQLAKDLVSAGHKVYGSVRSEEDAKRIKTELGENFTGLIFDVTDYEAIDAAAEEVAALEPEGIQCLVNNAGVVVPGPLLHVPMEEFEQQFRVNVFGQMKVTQAFAPLLGARKDHPVKPGRIVQISSVSGKVGMPFVGPYVGSKHALEGLSDSLRRELMLYGIDVIVVGPGAVKTPIWFKRSDAEEAYAKTDFAPALEVFKNDLVRPLVKDAIEVETLSGHLVKIIQSNRPKARYTFTNRKFTNYTLPRLLPKRIIDRAVQKSLKLFPGSE